MAFGIAMGMVLSFTFIAAQWAGEMIGQQMGLNISEVFDPQFGAGRVAHRRLYFMLDAGGVPADRRASRDDPRACAMSFRSLPLLSLGVDRAAAGHAGRACSSRARRWRCSWRRRAGDDAGRRSGAGMHRQGDAADEHDDGGTVVRSLLGLIVLIVGIGADGQRAERATDECDELRAVAMDDAVKRARLATAGIAFTDGTYGRRFRRQNRSPDAAAAPGSARAGQHRAQPRPDRRRAAARA